ncbi:hypothetical protein TNCV_2437361 [Trichonephila clavipes]|nr:hypothetical protein TNCV_2437361 [Trichonephila clavipes]
MATGSFMSHNYSSSQKCLEKKKLGLRGALDLLQNLPSEINNVLTDDFSHEEEGCGGPVVKVSDHRRHVMSSSPVPPKTHHAGQRCTLNLSR